MIIDIYFTSTKGEFCQQRILSLPQAQISCRSKGIIVRKDLRRIYRHSNLRVYHHLSTII